LVSFSESTSTNLPPRNPEIKNEKCCYKNLVYMQSISPETYITEISNSPKRYRINQCNGLKPLYELFQNNEM
jgi:hypothetical protein